MPRSPVQRDNTDRPYHHGDLRQALLDAALTLTTEVGLDGFTLREVARRAGVSHAAPYRHFADKGALVEALAVNGWQALTRQLEEAAAASAGDSLTSVTALGVAYVRFADLNAPTFRLMVRPELHRNGSDTVRSAAVEQAAQAAFRVLVNSVAQGQTQGVITEDEVHGLALTAWATVHGLAVILLDGLLDQQETERSAVLARLVTHTLMVGLATR